jgi:ABC-type polysaccharide/polyol phosphate export permease
MAQVASLGYIPDFFYQIYLYREYLKQSVLRDLRTKYKRSMLGYLWTMLHPLLMMSVLATVFSHIMRMPISDYAIFLFAALLPWNFFSSSVMMSLNTVRVKARLFEQVPIPKYIFIVSIICSNLFNLLVALVPLFLLMIFFGRAIPLSVLAFPAVFFPLCLVTVGLALTLAAANVFFDDTLHLSEVALSALYFLTPVLYHRDLLPGSLVKWLVFNPLFCQVEFIRAVFYDGVFPDMNTYLVNLGGSLLVLLFGLFVFKSSEDKFLYFV